MLLHEVDLEDKYLEIDNNELVIFQNRLLLRDLHRIPVIQLQQK